MKMLKIQQLLSYQQYHDSTYHLDIYNRDVIDKIKHFNLHLTKYFAKLVLNINSQYQTSPIIKSIFIDMTLISLSLANTLNLLIPDVDLLNGITTDTQYPKLITNDFSSIIYNLSKSLDAYDHIEDYNVRLQLSSNVLNMFILIQKFIYISDIKDFEINMNERYKIIQNKFLC